MVARTSRASEEASTSSADSSPLRSSSLEPTSNRARSQIALRAESDRTPRAEFLGAAHLVRSQRASFVELGELGHGKRRRRAPREHGRVLAFSDDDHRKHVRDLGDCCLATLPRPIAVDDA